MRNSAIILVASAVLAWTSVAFAGPTLRAGPMRLDNIPGPHGGGRLNCAVVNVSNKPLEVAITTTMDGVSVTALKFLVPGAWGGNASTNNGATSHLGHCAFEVIGGGRDDVRATACVGGHVNFEGCVTSLPAL